MPYKEAEAFTVEQIWRVRAGFAFPEVTTRITTASGMRLKGLELRMGMDYLSTIHAPLIFDRLYRMMEGVAGATTAEVVATPQADGVAYT